MASVSPPSDATSRDCASKSPCFLISSARSASRVLTCLSFCSASQICLATYGFHGVHGFCARKCAARAPILLMVAVGVGRGHGRDAQERARARVCSVVSDRPIDEPDSMMNH